MSMCFSLWSEIEHTGLVVESLRNFTSQVLKPYSCVWELIWGQAPAPTPAIHQWVSCLISLPPALWVLQSSPAQLHLPADLALTCTCRCPALRPCYPVHWKVLQPSPCNLMSHHYACLNLTLSTAKGSSDLSQHGLWAYCLAP